MTPHCELAHVLITSLCRVNRYASPPEGICTRATGSAHATGHRSRDIPGSGPQGDFFLRAWREWTGMLLSKRAFTSSQHGQQGMRESLYQFIKRTGYFQQIHDTDKGAHNDDCGHILVEILAEDTHLHPLSEQIFRNL